MTFLELYGEALNIELASSDTTQLFTTARRKAAINEAMTAFVKETGCTKRTRTLTMVDEDGEYVLDTEFTDFLRLAGEPSIRVLNASSQARWIQGKDSFPRRDIEMLDWERPGWRDLDPATPDCWYVETTDGNTVLGVVPAPLFASGETWTIRVPTIVTPTAMSADGDIPFTINSDQSLNLAPFHQGLAHYAAGRLESLRKNYDGYDRQMRVYAGYVVKWFAQRQQDGPGVIQIARDYYGEQRRPRIEDPWR